jgi:hypothetical protein
MMPNRLIRILCTTKESCSEAIEALDLALKGTAVSIVWTGGPKAGDRGDVLAYGVLIFPTHQTMRSKDESQNSVRP